MDGTAIDPTAPGSGGPLPDPRRWRALAVLGSAFFMVILDATIVLTAVPSMQRDLGFTVSGVQWVLTAYAVAFGGLMLFFGRVADLLGRRRVFMAGELLFVASSLLCGLAWSAEALVAARALQGVSAAIMAPTALSIVMTVFPDGAERNKALGFWGGLGGFGATAGLLIGGVLTSAVSWEWIFFSNVPVGILVLALVPRLVDDSRDRRQTRSFDLPGAATLTAGLLLLVHTVSKAPELGWGSGRVLSMFAAAAVLLVVFAVVERRAAAPLVPLRIFRLRTLVAGNLVILAVGMAVDGMLFPLTLYAQEVLDYSALQFGLMSAVMTGMSIVGAMAGQALVTRFGLRPVTVPSLALITAGCALLMGVSAGGTFVDDVLLGLLVFGPGMGGAFVASQIAALTGVAEEEAGLASGLVDTSFNIGSALGIAVVTSVAVSRTRDVMAADGGRAGELVALTAGFRSAFLVAAVFGGLGLVAALLMPGRHAAGHDDDAPRTPAGVTRG